MVPRAIGVAVRNGSPSPILPTPAKTRRLPNTCRSAGSLSEDERGAIEAALERMERRQPFLDTTFSRRTVNDAFRAGRHRQMMRQQLI